MQLRHALLVIATSALFACGSEAIRERDATPHFSFTGEPSLIEFHIVAGTARSAWNTKETAVTVKIGDTLRIINDDTSVHRLHTNGIPCPHAAANMEAGGGFYDCVIAKAIDPETDGALYDHNHGPNAAFWVKTVTP